MTNDREDLRDVREPLSGGGRATTNLDNAPNKTIIRLAGEHCGAQLKLTMKGIT